MSNDSKILNAYANSVNVAAELSEEELLKIGNRVLVGYREDLKSMEEWLSDVKKIEELAELKCIKKTTPLLNSANVKLPMIIKAVYEFSSSTYPEIFKDNKLVKAAIIGKDDKDNTKAMMARRVADFMNYQLLFEHQEWELECDRLLNLVALIGFICKKTYYDPIRQMNKSEMCDYKELIVHQNTKSLADASRITHEIHLKLNDLIEAKNKEVNSASVFLPKAVDEIAELHKNDEIDKDIDVLEQHCKLDLDKDGYAEPYIVTVNKVDGKVLRIVARFTKDGICRENGKVCYITPIRCFVDYHFLVSPKGKFQSVGFGFLLLHLNESCNSVLNQLLDAGQLANMQGGYRDARCKMIESGIRGFVSGEWKEVKVMTGASLKEGMMPIQYKEPSNVLHQLLGMLIEVARDLTASAQINNGTQSSENAKTGATIALQQAGKKIFNSITKRIYRSLNEEFKQLFVLNSLYLDPVTYRDIEADTLAVKNTDFDIKKIKVLPVADPNLASDGQRIMEAQFMQAMYDKPGIDGVATTKAILTRSQIPDIMDIMVDPKAKQPPNPQMLELQAKMEEAGQKLNIEGRKLDLQEKQQLIDAHKAEGIIALQEAQTMLAVEQAKAISVTHQFKDLQMQFDIISKKVDAQLGLADMQHQKDMQATDQQHQKDLQAQQLEQQGGQDGQTESPGGVPQSSGNEGASPPAE